MDVVYTFERIPPPTYQATRCQKTEYYKIDELLATRENNFYFEFVSFLDVIILNWIINYGLASARGIQVVNTAVPNRLSALLIN
jgi:hypothetical protein